MATADGGNSAVINALALGQIECASLLLSEGSPLDLQRATEVVIDKGQYETLKFLLSNYKLDVDKHFLLHRALVVQQENIAKLLVQSGAVNTYYEETGSIHIEYEEEGCAHYSSYLPLQLSLFCPLDMTCFLLDFGAEVNKRNESGETALEFACRVSVSADRVAFLLENGAKVNTEYRGDVTALHWAARLGDTEKLILLIDHGADIEADVNDYGCTSLMWACDNSESVDCLKILLENRANCRAINFSTKETGLHLAAKSGNSMALKLFIQYGAQLEARTDHGDTALILACGESVPAECVSILLENGAFPNVQNTDKKTPLKIAKETRNKEKIQKLLQYGATEENRIDQEETNLMRACRKTGNFRAVLRLLQKNGSPNVKNHRGQTALHIAADRGDIETLKALVQYKADVNAMAHLDETPLMLACDNRSVNVNCIKLVLENKALPNVTDPHGHTALHMAVRSGVTEKLEILTQYEADVNALNKCVETPLMLACDKSSVECVKFLLQNKALPNVTDVSGETALHKAVRSGAIEKLEILVQCGADVNAMTNVYRKTPLMMACDDSCCCSVKCVKFLLENKASPNVADSAGDTALHWAAHSLDTEKVKILVQYGANVNVRNLRRETPVALAHARCLTKNLSSDKRGAITTMVKLLVKHGADLEVKTSWGETGFLTAVRKGNRQLVRLLHNLGVDVCAEDGKGRNAIMLAIRTVYRDRKTCDLRLFQYWIDTGVSVNHRDKNGWTPLMLASDCDNVETLKYLLKVGADVHAIRTEEIFDDVETFTALSIALEKESEWERCGCVADLIRHGAVNSLHERYNVSLHQMIQWDRREMIQLLLTNGIAPTMSDSVSLHRFGPVGPVSPLTVALNGGNIPVIQYLLGNLMLCPCDIYGHSYFSQWRHKLISENMTDIVTTMDEFYSQPKSLFQLSFVTVSHALGGVPGRVDRVNNLPLPSIIKDILLFKCIDVPMER